MIWAWLAGAAVAAFALDRAALWAESRGWIYWRRRKPGGGGGGVFNELVELFEPAHRHVVEEQDWRRYQVAERESGDPPLLAVDLDSGSATLASPHPPTPAEPTPGPPEP